MHADIQTELQDVHAEAAIQKKSIAGFLELAECEIMSSYKSARPVQGVDVATPQGGRQSFNRMTGIRITQIRCLSTSFWL